MLSRSEIITHKMRIVHKKLYGCHKFKRVTLGDISIMDDPFYNTAFLQQCLIHTFTAGKPTSHPTEPHEGPFGSGAGVIHTPTNTPNRICFNTGYMLAPADYCFTSRAVKGDRAATADYTLSVSVDNPPQLSIE